MTPSIAPPSDDSLRAALHRDGYVLIPNALPTAEVETLRAASERAAAATRAGAWPHFRSLPQPFPPWTGSAPADGIWGVQHLLHPAQPDGARFARSYFHEAVVGPVTALLGSEQAGRAPRAELVMELYNLLVRPDRDFALRWHRDDIGPEVGPEEELRRLQAPMVHAQWNLALHPDASLLVVPGSHRRARTEAERNADPFADDLPGQQVVRMQPGDVVFYDNNILHRGVYDSTVERCTRRRFGVIGRRKVHGSMGIKSGDPARARVILQHGIGEWVADCDFSQLPGDMAILARGMQARLIEIGSSGEQHGYSQRD